MIPLWPSPYVTQDTQIYKVGIRGIIYKTGGNDYLKKKKGPNERPLLLGMCPLCFSF